MTKRLKYTKDILTHMLNNNNKPMSGNGPISATSNGGTGVPQSTSSNRNGMVSSAVSSKRSMMSTNGDTVLPSAALGRTGGSA